MIDSIKIPTLLINKEICFRNIRRMNAKAKKSGVRFRPHFKTHQSHEVGRWFRDFGVERITVSSLRMADYFARDEWQDITISTPVNIREIGDYNRLLRKIKLNLVVEDLDVCIQLNRKIRFPADVYLKIDAGYGRTGIKSEKIDLIDAFFEKQHDLKKLNIAGFLSHFGNTYSSGSAPEIKLIYNDSIRKLRGLKKRYSGFGYSPEISIGDTPSCTAVDRFDGIGEIRPGNFVYYDLMQEETGIAKPEDIAVCLAAPVIAVHDNGRKCVLHCGAVHLSKDFLLLKDSTKSFGRAIILSSDGWNCNEVIGNVISVSQEHGIVQVNKDYHERIVPGQLIGVLPVHSCLTANLASNYLSTDGFRIKKMRG